AGEELADPLGDRPFARGGARRCEPASRCPIRHAAQLPTCAGAETRSTLRVVAATVVLVHGAWHGAWGWGGRRARLGPAGLDVWAIDNPSVLDPEATMHDDADAVRSLLERASGDVVLVGHSYGGAVIGDAGAHPAVRRLVFLTAFVLDVGESLSENALHGGE